MPNPNHTNSYLNSNPQSIATPKFLRCSWQCFLRYFAAFRQVAGGGSPAFVCLSVCLFFHTIAQQPTHQTWHQTWHKNVSRWVLENIYFVIRRSKVKVTRRKKQCRRGSCSRNSSSGSSSSSALYTVMVTKRRAKRCSAPVPTLLNQL